MKGALMEYVPFEMGEISFAANLYQPSTQKTFNNHSFIFWERALFQRAASSMMFELPKEWSDKTKDFFLYVMFRYGYVVVFKTDKYGLIFQPCTLSGYNVYYQPTTVLVSNPALPGLQPLGIGSDCELLKLTPDYCGVWDIIRYYAEKLALLDGSINMTITNSRISYILGAKNKGAATALKNIMDKVNEGQSLVVYDKEIECGLNDTEPWTAFDRKNIKESYLGTELLDNARTLINNFDKEIGIPSLPNEKKERMINAEAYGAIIDGMSRAIIWEETFNNSANDVNEMFGTNISVKLRYKDVIKGG